MTLFINLITVIAALSYLVLSVEGFPRRAIPSRTARHTRPGDVCRSDERNVIFFDSPPTANVGAKFVVVGNDEGSVNWTLEEDWALIDNLPLFTVSSTLETKTFWTQLWSANAILFSTKKTEDLYRRVQELEYQRDARLERHETKFQKRSPSLRFGSSPPVLENWKIDMEGNDNRVVGQVDIESSGHRTIWFHYHMIGRLTGDPFADKSSSVVSLFPGGYIEAVGGRVYELGQPMLLDKWETKTNSELNNQQQKIDVGPVRGDDESSATSRWWIPGSTAAISALVSSTILSACIGYGAGLSIIQDSSYHHTTPPPPKMLTVETVLAGPSQKGYKIPSQSSALAAGTRQSSISDSLSPDQRPSTEELRTRTEYKVLREEQLLKKISQRLELDKQTLKQLEEQQQQQQQSSDLLP